MKGIEIRLSNRDRDRFRASPSLFNTPKMGILSKTRLSLFKKRRGRERRRRREATGKKREMENRRESRQIL